MFASKAYVLLTHINQTTINPYEITPHNQTCSYNIDVISIGDSLQ